MAQRYEIGEVVDKTGSVQGASGNVTARVVAAGLSGTVKDLSGNNLTVYSAETGAGTLSNPLTSDSAGRFEGWVEAPDFDLQVSGTGITTYTQKVRQSPPGVFDALSYGISSGATAAANATAMTGLVTALPARGARVKFPGSSASYQFSSWPSLDNKTGILFCGDHTRYGSSNIGATHIEYTGTGTFISAKSSQGLQWENLYVSGFSMGAAGCLFDLDASVADTALWGFRDCWIRGLAGGTGTLIKLDKAIIGRITACLLDGGTRAIRGKATAGSYSNAITIDGETLFQNHLSAPILNPGQSWNLSGACFQQLSGGGAGGVEVESGFIVQSFRVVNGTSFQDANTTGDWLSLRGEAITVEDCLFHTGARHVHFPVGVSGGKVKGNWMGKANTAAIALAGTCTGEFSPNFFSSGIDANTADITGLSASTGRIGIRTPQDGEGTLGGVAWPAANRALFTRFVPIHDMPVSAIAYHVATADAGNPNVDVGIYDRGSARLASSGATAGKLNSTGVQTVNLTTTVTLRQGEVYYVAVSTPSTTAALVMDALTSGTSAELFGTAIPTIEQGFRDTMHPLPNPIGGALTSTHLAPRLALRAT